MKKTILFFSALLFFICSSAQEANKTDRGNLGLTLSFPWANNYCYYDYQLKKTKGKTGFVGIGLAAYYKHNRNSFSFNTGITSDLPAPIGPIDFGKTGTRNQVSTLFFDLLYHREIISELGLIGGINLTRYNYQLISFVDTIPSFGKRDYGIGPVLGVEIIPISFVSFAALYRPAFPIGNSHSYKHVISLDLRLHLDFTGKNSPFR